MFQEKLKSQREDWIFQDYSDKMEKEKCRKTELRDVVITVRVTKKMRKFMKDNGYAPSQVMIEALKMLGFK